MPIRRAAAALVLALAATLAAAPDAQAVNFAGLSAQARSPGGLTFERARVSMTGLQRPTFDRADANGDGVVDGTEWPMLQALYSAIHRTS